MKTEKIFISILGFLAALGILAVNYYLVYPWFSGNGPINIGSIEVSYVSMARFIRDFGPNLSFAPYWYFGFPFHLFYTPFLPVSEFLLNNFSQISLWQSYRIMTGIGLVLTPVSLFLFAWYLTKKIVPAILTALSFTFLPSLFYYVLPSGEVAEDVISQGFFDPRRIVILARWGEGPHILSMVFIPLAGLFYLKALRRNKIGSIFLAALFIGLTALTNAVGLYGLVLLLLALFFSELTEKKKSLKDLWQPVLLTATLSYGLIAFWYNLSFVGTFFGESGGVLKNYLTIFPWGFLGLILLFVGLYYFFKKLVKNRAAKTAILWFLTLFLIVYVYYVSAPQEFSELRLELAPQALRLMTETDMAFSLLFGSILAWVITFLEKRGFALKVVGNLVGVFLCGLVLVYGLSYLPFGQKAVSGEIDLNTTGEQEIAQWLADNTDQVRGERVYVPGNYGFFLNYFTDVWQLRGGLYQAKTHNWPEHIYYQINHGKSRLLANAWLKIANVKYIVVTTDASRELYKEYAFPAKFKSLKQKYKEHGDIIYEVPLKGGTSPAKIINLEAFENLETPIKADDEPPIFAYVKQLDKSRPADFEVINNDLYKIKANLKEGEAVLVQITYDKGFRAKSNLGGVKIKRGPMDFMILKPKQSGEQEITLRHGKTWKIWLGYLITIGTVMYLISRIILRKKSAPNNS